MAIENEGRAGTRLYCRLVQRPMPFRIAPTGGVLVGRQRSLGGGPVLWRCSSNPLELVHELIAET